MGFGVPAAVGAKVAAPEKIVVNVDGDASFSMTAMELQTCNQYNIGVKVSATRPRDVIEILLPLLPITSTATPPPPLTTQTLLFNNEFQGMVEQWQDLFYR